MNKREKLLGNLGILLLLVAAVYFLYRAYTLKDPPEQSPTGTTHTTGLSDEHRALDYGEPEN